MHQLLCSRPLYYFNISVVFRFPGKSPQALFFVSSFPGREERGNGGDGEGSGQSVYVMLFYFILCFIHFIHFKPGLQFAFVRHWSFKSKSFSSAFFVPLSPGGLLSPSRTIRNKSKDLLTQVVTMALSRTINCKVLWLLVFVFESHPKNCSAGNLASSVNPAWPVTHSVRNLH